MAGHLVKYGKHRTRRSYASIKEVLDVPNLIEIQTASYQWFLDDGIKEMFGDIMPIDDFQGTLSLEYVDYQLMEPKYNIDEAREHDANYSAPLHVTLRLCRWQYLIAPNQYSQTIFKSAFGFHHQFLSVGYPRNDRLYTTLPAEITDLKQQLLGSTKGPVVTYAPTWRDDMAVRPGVYQFDLPFDLAEFFQHVPANTQLIIRPHYLVKDAIDIHGFEERVHVLAETDITDLYLISDLLITDYSSVMFDFANLQRPQLFFAYDLAHYRDQLRGFYFDYEQEIPGPLVTTASAFYAQLDRWRQDGAFHDYQARQAAFYEKFCSWENGTASRQVVQVMLHGKDEIK